MAAYAGIDNFDSYADGDLHGENGGSGWSAAWSGSTNYDVQGTITVDGGKAVTLSSTTEDTISRTLTSAADSGDVYWSIRRNSTNDIMNVAGGDGGDTESSWAWRTQWVQGGGAIIANGDGGSGDIISSPSEDTWYDIHINIVSSTTFKARGKLSSSSTWGSYTSTLTFFGARTSFDRIVFSQGNNGGTSTFYLDRIQNTDPTGTTFTPKVMMF